MRFHTMQLLLGCGSVQRGGVDLPDPSGIGSATRQGRSVKLNQQKSHKLLCGQTVDHVAINK